MIFLNRKERIAHSTNYIMHSGFGLLGLLGPREQWPSIVVSMSVCVCVSVCLSVCVSVCPRAYPEPHARFFQFFCACCLRPWLGPPATGWRNTRRRGQFWGFSSLLTMHYNAFAAKGWFDRTSCSRRDHSVAVAFAANGIGWEGGDGSAQCDLRLPCLAWSLSHHPKATVSCPHLQQFEFKIQYKVWTYWHSLSLLFTV